MGNILKNRGFRYLVAVPSLVWIVAAIIYVSEYMGWDNVFQMLPHEIGGTIISIILPVLVLVVCYFGILVLAQGATLRDAFVAQNDRIDKILAAQNERLGKTVSSLGDLVGQANERNSRSLADILSAVAALADLVNDAEAARVNGVEDAQAKDKQNI